MSTFTTGRARHLVKKLSPLVENFVAFARTLAFRKQPAQLFLNLELEPGGARTRIDLNDLGDIPEREHAFEQAIYWLAWVQGYLLTDHPDDRHPDNILANNIESLLSALKLMAGDSALAPSVDRIVVAPSGVRRVIRSESPTHSNRSHPPGATELPCVD
jgi:hypothetical protein